MEITSGKKYTGLRPEAPSPRTVDKGRGIRSKGQGSVNITAYAHRLLHRHLQIEIKRIFASVLIHILTKALLKIWFITIINTDEISTQISIWQ